MATTFDREIRPVDITQLQNELNGSIDITATVVSIDLDTASTTGNNITINWNTDLLSAEITTQDSLVLSHVVQIQDVSLAELPFSDLGAKLAIHSSTKPAPPGDKEFYLVWTGAGDDVASSPNIIGDGEILQFNMQSSTPEVIKEVKFSPLFGDVYIHEGYAKWDNGGTGDHIEAMVVAESTTLQQSVNLDLVVENNWVKYSSSGAGTGTHGFAATPNLIKRSKSKDGDWDYDAVNGLLPNMSGTGLYKISDVEREVHHYINKIPTFGNSYGYTRLTSDETAFLPQGYFLRIIAHNISNTAWTACVFIEVFREQTAVP